MTFEHAPISKGIMIGCALTSLLAGIFDVKHYLHLQLVPHISRHHQYWRLFVHHFAFQNSSDLFVSEIIFYNVAVQIERHFGTLKFASFAVVTTLLSTFLEFTSLMLFNRIGLNYIPPGPIALLFGIIYQYSRIIPPVYNFRIFGVMLNNKSFTYFLAFQLTISHPPSTLALTLVGLLSGALYRADLVGIRYYRLPSSLISFSEKYLLPLIGTLRAPKRTNRALPEAGASLEGADEEIVSTARASASLRARRRNASRNTNTSTANVTPVGSFANDEEDEEEQTEEESLIPTPSNEPRTDIDPRGGSGRSTTNIGSASSSTGGIMREWMNELTGRSDRSNAGGLHVPSENEVELLTGMFPDIERDVVLGALQRSANIEQAAETLLASQS